MAVMTKEQALKKAEELNAARKDLSNAFEAHASTNPKIWVVCEYLRGKCVDVIMDAE